MFFKNNNNYHTIHLLNNNNKINSATSLLILLLIILSKSSLFIIAGGGVHRIPQLNISVGKLFTFEISEGHFIDIERLPKWCKFNTTAKLLYGIPQLENVGLEHIVIHDSLIEVKVYEEEENFCGIDNSINWLEIMDPRLLTKMTIEEQFQTVKNLLSMLKSTQLRINDVRIFPRSYLERYRHVTETLYELASNILINNNYDKNNGVVISLNISCGEIDEQASNIISEIAENGLAFQVVEGELRNDRPLIFTTTQIIQSTTSATTRTTRRIHQLINEINKKPILINPIKSFHCSRGILCRLPIDENTFLDPEDGHTSKLNLSVHSIENNKNNNFTNFLVVLANSNIIEGIPITGEFGEGSAKEEEEFNFRLEARDKQNAANSASFQVFVSRSPIDGPKPNHRFSMILDVPIERFYSRPEMLRDFVYRLSGILHRFPLQITSSLSTFLQSHERIEAATEIYIDRIVDNGSGQTLLQWWNTTISRTQCDEKRINLTKERMVHQHHHTGVEKVRHEFAKQMGAQFHVKKVTLELLGKCLAQHMLDSMRVRVYTTTQRNTLLSQNEGVFSSWWTQTLLVPIILIATILLLITILILLCCAHHRRGKKGATINRRNEYNTKGRPVVFPDEVPHRDESSSADGSLATVTTPMLLEREQPPLDPNKMTMHENPLYRPPPQLQAQLTKNGAANLSSGIINGQKQQHEMSPLNGGSPGCRQYVSQQQKSPPPQMVSTFSPPGALRAIDASPTPQRALNPSSIPSTFQRDNPHQYSVRFHQHSTPVGQRMPPPYMAH